MFHMCMNAPQTQAGDQTQAASPRSLSSLPEFCIRAKYRALHEQHSRASAAFGPRWKSAHSWQSTACRIGQDRCSTNNGFFLNATIYFSKVNFAIRTKTQQTEPERFFFRRVHFTCSTSSIDEDEEDEEVSIIFNILVISAQFSADPTTLT